MPTSENKLVPIESAYSDDEGEMALVKENKQVGNMLCNANQVYVITCNTYPNLNLFPLYLPDLSINGARLCKF